MPFQMTKWSWKATAARLMLVPILATAPGTIARAQESTSATTSGSPERARQLTALANRALQNGDLSNAEKYAKQAVSLKAELAADEPKPQNVLAEITRRRSNGNTVVANANANRGADPKELLKMAKQSLAAGKFDEAQDLTTQANAAANSRGNKWGLFEDTPATVMKDIQEARAKGDKVKSDQIFQQARALASKPAATDAERMANLDSAMQMAYQAKNLHGPYSLWDLGDKPDSLIGEIEATKAQLRKKLPTVDTAAARSKMQQAQQATQTAANNVKSAVQGTMQQAASA
ncbi:MAG: hypothetical protein ACRCZF_04700, partial [Gemmataceae bacterium]